MLKEVSTIVGKVTVNYVGNHAVVSLAGGFEKGDISAVSELNQKILQELDKEEKKVVVNLNDLVDVPNSGVVGTVASGLKTSKTLQVDFGLIYDPKEGRNPFQDLINHGGLEEVYRNYEEFMELNKY